MLYLVFSILPLAVVSNIQLTESCLLFCVCFVCSSGGKSGSVVRCKKCHGSGIQVSHRPIGPGMVQQIQSMCSDCGGTGDFIKEKDRCKKCKGKRTVEVNNKLEVSTDVHAICHHC